MFKGLMSKLAGMFKPLWKSAAKKLMAYELKTLRDHLKAMVDDDRDASIMRVDHIFDMWQDRIVAGINKLSWIPSSISHDLTDKVMDEGDSLQEKLVEMIKTKGPGAIDAAFDGVEAKINALIDRA